MTKIRTIKVGQDAITGGSKPHYALVSDRKVVAIGSKEEMLELNQEIDGRVWLTNAKVDEVVEARIPQTEDGPCWDTHKQVGMKKKGNRLVPNCVPKEAFPAAARFSYSPKACSRESPILLVTSVSLESNSIAPFIAAANTRGPAAAIAPLANSLNPAFKISALLLPAFNSNFILANALFVLISWPTKGSLDNAGIALTQLKRYNDNLNVRKQCHNVVKNLNLNGRLLPHDDNSSYYFDTLICDKDSITDLYAEYPTSKHYPLIHKTKLFNQKSNIPNTEKLHKLILNLPLFNKDIYNK